MSLFPGLAGSHSQPLPLSSRVRLPPLAAVQTLEIPDVLKATLDDQNAQWNNFQTSSVVTVNSVLKEKAHLNWTRSGYGLRNCALLTKVFLRAALSNVPIDENTEAVENRSLCDNRAEFTIPAMSQQDDEKARNQYTFLQTNERDEVKELAEPGCDDNFTASDFQRVHLGEAEEYVRQAIEQREAVDSKLVAGVVPAMMPPSAEGQKAAIHSVIEKHHLRYNEDDELTFIVKMSYNLSQLDTHMISLWTKGSLEAGVKVKYLFFCKSHTYSRTLKRWRCGLIASCRRQRVSSSGLRQPKTFMPSFFQINENIFLCNSTR